MSEGNWKDNVDKARDFIENNNLARGECFVAMQTAILKFGDDTTEIFKCGVMFGAAKMLDVEPEINQAVTLAQFRIENKRLQSKINELQDENPI